MERGSTKHGAELDDEIQHETEGMMRSGQPTHAEEFTQTTGIPPNDTDVDATGDEAE